MQKNLNDIKMAQAQEQARNGAKSEMGKNANDASQAAVALQKLDESPSVQIVTTTR